MSDKACLVETLTTPPSPESGDLHGLSDSVGWRQPSLSEPTISQLIQDYGLPELPAQGDLYGIVGSPVAHSLSPRLHNAAYRALGLPGLFVPFQETSFDDFWRHMVATEPLQSFGASIKGLTVASPHKETALHSGASTSAMVQRANATNIVTRHGNGWVADTTDPEGTLLALHEHGIAIACQKAAVVGCGGAGRAVAAALTASTARRCSRPARRRRSGPSSS